MKSQLKPIAKVLRRCKRVKPMGNGYIALCPAHDDNNPSLSIGVGRDHRVLLYCHAGCSLERVLEAMHLDKEDLYLSPKKELKTVYTYVDADGNPIYEVVRLEGKKFYVRHKTEHSYKKGLNGRPRVLYNLPALLNAIADNKVVFVVEGEKDAENLAKAFGVVVTTSPFGAGGWRDTYSDVLVGAKIIIIADNDEAGRQYAQSIASTCYRKAKSIRIVDLPGIAEGEDISDWIEGGGTKKELKNLCKQATCWEPSEDEDLPEYKLDILHKVDDLNETYATIMVKGKYLVIQPDAYDPSLNRSSIEFISTSSLEKKFAHDKVIIAKKSDNPVYRNAIQVWLEHPNRRDYDGIIFDPGRSHGSRYFNLWRGYAFKPRRFCIDLYLNHIFEVIAAGDIKVYDHIIALLADAIQLRARPGVAIAIIGSQGTGKGVFVINFGLLFGRHFLHITQASHLTGRFNRHLAEGMIVFVDEAFWAGDKQAEGTLKAIVTEETMMIEPKGIDPYPVKNHNRLILASNNDWIVPAGMEERRFFVVRASDSHMQDREYFARIQAEMNNGGHAGLLYYLLNYNLDNIDLTAFPRTSELGNQKMLSMDPAQRFWYAVLQDGQLFGPRRDSDNLLSKIPWYTGKVETAVLFEAFIEFLKGQPTKWFAGAEGFGIALKKLIPDLSKKRIKGKMFYCLPTLESCRLYFDRITGQQWEWANIDTDDDSDDMNLSDIDDD